MKEYDNTLTSVLTMGICTKGLTKVALCQKVDKLASYQEEDTCCHTAAQDDE